MSKKAPTSRGISTDNETARERTILERTRLNQIRDLEVLFRSDPRFPAQMSFSVFKGRLGAIYRYDESSAYVKDWNGKTYSFPLTEKRRALEFAVRLLANRPIISAEQKSVDDADSSPKTVRTKAGKIVRVWRG